MPSAGEYLGNEEGREIGEAARDIGLLGLAGRHIIKAPGIPSKVIGGALIAGDPIARGAYNLLYGDEE